MLQESIWFPGAAGFVSFFCFIFSAWSLWISIKEKLNRLTGQNRLRCFFSRSVWRMKSIFMLGFVLVNLGLSILFIAIWLKNYYFLINLNYPGYQLIHNATNAGWGIVFVGLLFKARALTYDRFGEVGWILIVLLSAGFVGLFWLVINQYYSM